jgi:hypothetical protein
MGMGAVRLTMAKFPNMTSEQACIIVMSKYNTAAKVIGGHVPVPLIDEGAMINRIPAILHYHGMVFTA